MSISNLFDNINQYEIGDVVRVSGVFTNQVRGAAIDPAVVTFLYKPYLLPTVTLTYGIDAAVVRDGTGNYHVDVDANASGPWTWRWASTGIGQAADEGQFYVKPTLV